MKEIKAERTHEVSATRIRFDSFHNYSFITYAAELPLCSPDKDLYSADSKYKAKHGIIFAAFQSGKTVLAVLQPNTIITAWQHEI